MIIAGHGRRKNRPSWADRAVLSALARLLCRLTRSACQPNIRKTIKYSSRKAILHPPTPFVHHASDAPGVATWRRSTQAHDPGPGAALGGRESNLRGCSHHTASTRSCSVEPRAALSPAGYPSERITATLHEAELLGLVAHNALSPTGRALTAHLPPTGCPQQLPNTARRAIADSLDEVFPSVQDTALFQSDLTVVVPGLPGPELVELLDSAADPEARPNTTNASSPRLPPGVDPRPRRLPVAGASAGRAAARAVQ